MSTAPIWEQNRLPMWARALNRAARTLGKAGRRWPRLGPDALEAAARRRAGLSDFGDGLYREGLTVLVDAFNARDDAHAFGRLFFREFVTGLLVNRLKITRDLRQNPAILDTPLPRPLFVTGLPRSGTTFLHRLLSEDPAARPLLFWETAEPSPPPAPETYRTDPRIARTRRSLDFLYSLSPALAAAHEFAAEGPEECNNLFAHSFRAGFLGFLFDVPDFVRWLERQDQTAPYLDVRKQLQLLSFQQRKGHWALKAPAHLFSLDALLAAFPDACVVQTHREPKEVVPSVCSLAAAFRGILTDRLDRRRLGAEFVEAMALGPSRAIAVREQDGDAHFHDVTYRGLVADPVGTVRGVYERFGYDFTPEFEARARRYLAENPRHKHGAHRYALDDFGLDAPAVDRNFAPYRAWVEARLGAGALG